MPISRITTLMHIINDPIISLSSGFRWDLQAGWGPGFTRGPRLCDLMSWEGLAYVFLATEP
jgi:hypothetical protein